jgi:hypothetical protein
LKIEKNSKEVRRKKFWRRGVWKRREFEEYMRREKNYLRRKLQAK